ncbi:SARP family transcriptional regulator [Lentzea guizhouensis]|uniref:SARP family transcriptional regulator n=2 Tax=Lentzea guizhouensis TaxID=1586287 RepID=A0A1B2HWC8_9PSEU|nr:SARP family transcriptional regulator [Lentzea guizhouensis]
MFRVLGPLDVSEEQSAAGVRGLRQRAALAFFLLHHDSPVTVARLERALWPFEAPPTGRQMVYNAVHALRRNGLPLAKESGGYRLRITPEQLDLACFRTLLARGEHELGTADWAAASRTFAAALALWRGRTLADLAEQDLCWPEMAALDNARLTALECRVEAEFRLGRYREVIGELETAVACEPLRERLCGQLMQALYHSGRQADALGLYRRTRADLIERLGLEPSPELRGLEHAILNHELAQPAVPRQRIGVVEHIRPAHDEPERLVREHAGIEPGDRTEVVAAKVRWVVRRVLGSGDTAARVRGHVIDLLAGVRTDETLCASALLLEKITQFHRAEVLSG